MNTSKFFDDYFDNAEVNSILVMDIEGYIIDINHSFTKNFGYRDEIRGKHFSILFTEADRKLNKPAIELQTVLAKRQANDENHIVDNTGQAIWCTGEALLVCGSGGEKYIVKDVVNLQARKQLNIFLKNTEEMLERIFETSKEVPMMIIDGSMKIERVNPPFAVLFDLQDVPPSGSRLSDINHPFWQSLNIKQTIKNILVTNKAVKDLELLFNSKSGQIKMLNLDSKIIYREPPMGRLVFIILEDITPNKKNGQV